MARSPYNEGVWVKDKSGSCDTERDGSSYWGRVRLEYDIERNRYVGGWGYCDKEPTLAWEMWP